MSWPRPTQIPLGDGAATLLLSGETNEQDQRLKWVDVCGLYLLHFHIYRVADKKIFKSLWDVHKKVAFLLRHFKLKVLLQFSVFTCLASDTFHKKCKQSSIRYMFIHL